MVTWENNINFSIETYANPSYEKFKSYERFAFVKNIAEKKLKRGGDLLDIGCAKGEFIWYLKDFFSNIFYTGIDISKKLISIAQNEEKLRDVVFMIADIQSLDLQKEFDFVMMNGVLSIFDDYQKIIGRILKHLKAGGYGYIFGIFTENDVDVLVRYRNNYLESTQWESGYNMFSLNSIRKTLVNFSTNIVFHKFHLGATLEKKPNPVDSYTLNTDEKGKIILCGANILNEFYLVEFKKK